MDSFSESGAYVASSQVEVCTQVAKVSNDFDGVVDVVPNQVA